MGTVNGRGTLQKLVRIHMFLSTTFHERCEINQPRVPAKWYWLHVSLLMVNNLNPRYCQCPLLSELPMSFKPERKSTLGVSGSEWKTWYSHACLRNVCKKATGSRLPCSMQNYGMRLQCCRIFSLITSLGQPRAFKSQLRSNHLASPIRFLT
jgi:hypothetical protein